jgi:hypothetical protein
MLTDHEVKRRWEALPADYSKALVEYVLGIRELTIDEKRILLEARQKGDMYVWDCPVCAKTEVLIDSDLLKEFPQANKRRKHCNGSLCESCTETYEKLRKWVNED